MSHVLLIEDHLDLQELIRQTLESCGHEVTVMTSGKDCLKVLNEKLVSLILLDISLPDGDGFGLCAELQKNPMTKNIPVIFITGKGDVGSKVTAFSMGADDYLVKPFHLLELKARVEAKIKKLREGQDVGSTVWIGPVCFDLRAQALIRASNAGERDLSRLREKQTKLTPLEFKVLECLVKNESKVLSRTQILEMVWGENDHVVQRTIDTHIFSIRKKLGDQGKRIESVSGLGYRFVAA